MKKNNNNNNINLKEMIITTPITDHFPSNRLVGDTDRQSNMLS